MAKLGLAQIVRKLRQEYPNIYAGLTATKKKPLPEKKRRALYNKTLALSKGAEVTIPVRRGTFQIQTRFYWECADCTGFEILKFHPNPKASLRTEKALVKMLGEFCNADHYAIDHMIEGFREEIWKSAASKRFQKKVDALQREFEACEAAYDFDYDRDIGVETDC